MAKAEAVEKEETPKAAGGGNKMMMILMIVVIVLLLAVIGVGAMLLLKKPAADGGHAATTEQTADAKGDKHSDGADHKGEPVSIPLGQPITVNLSAPNDASLLQVELDLISYDKTAEASVKANRAEIINDIMLALSDVNAAKLRTREGKEALQKQLKDTVNAVLEKRAGKKDLIADVFFTKLLMQ
ncbi:flagellar basal body-associated protein FliL [Halothiobacillus sp. DCM-1]|uniref:flagellar basal body-associated FliL family protein n=1 Tax=Halothiobacillus sp. DCM-1 TaxID=3112558 RepID=UPI0032548520